MIFPTEVSLEATVVVCLIALAVGFVVGNILVGRHRYRQGYEQSKFDQFDEAVKKSRLRDAR